MQSNDSDAYQCTICYDPIKEPTILRACQHTFCNTCIHQWFMSQQGARTCPLCRQKSSNNKAATIIIRPKYDFLKPGQILRESAQLKSLREQLSAKKQELAKLEVDLNLKEEQYENELETLQEESKTLESEIGKLPTEKSKTLTKFEKVVQSSPYLSANFDKVYLEVTKKMKQLTENISYAEVHSSWTAAKKECDTREKIIADRAKIQTLMADGNRLNAGARKAFSGLKENELDKRISRETFKQLCRLMKWNGENYCESRMGSFVSSTQKSLPKFGWPSQASVSAAKRPPLMNITNRPAKYPRFEASHPSNSVITKPSHNTAPSNSLAG